MPMMIVILEHIWEYLTIKKIVYNDGHGNGIPDEGVVGVHALGDLNIKNSRI